MVSIVWATGNRETPATQESTGDECLERAAEGQERKVRKPLTTQTPRRRKRGTERRRKKRKRGRMLGSI